MRLTKLESLVERLLYEQSPAERKKLAQNIAEFGEDAIDPLLRAIDLKWETMDIETDLFICDALSYTYKKTGLHPFERILMDKTNSFLDRDDRTEKTAANTCGIRVVTDAKCTIAIRTGKK